MASHQSAVDIQIKRASAVSVRDTEACIVFQPEWSFHWDGHARLHRLLPDIFMMGHLLQCHDNAHHAFCLSGNGQPWDGSRQLRCEARHQNDGGCTHR